MSTPLGITRVAFDHHRNGVSGEPFWSARFEATWDVGQSEPFVAILIEPEDDEQFDLGRCYVLAIRDLLDGGPTRCWRGDHFELELRPLLAAAKHKLARDSALWGQFPIIVGMEAES